MGRRGSVSSSSTDTSRELKREKKHRKRADEKHRRKDKEQDKKDKEQDKKLARLEKTEERVEKKINKVEDAIEHKVQKKLHKTEDKIEEKVQKKLHKTEDAIEHKVDEKLNKVEDAVENKVLRGIYQKLKHKLRRDGCLYVNGADAFAFAYAAGAQVIEAGEPLLFTGAPTVLNVDYKPGQGTFHICRDGLYDVELAATFDVSGTLALAVNEVTVVSTITAFTAGVQGVIQAILPLKKGMCVKFWNYDISGGAVLAAAPQPYGGVNASVTMKKIAPWTKKFGGCCPLPPLPCYESDNDCKSKSTRSSRCSSRSSWSSKSSKSSRSSYKKKPCKPEGPKKHEGPKKSCRKPRSRSSSRSSRSSRSSSCSSRSSRSSGISTASRSSSEYSYCDKKRGCDRGRK